MKPGFRATMAVFACLAVLAFLTLEGKIRLATMIFLAGFGAKVGIEQLRRRGEKR
ncbi:MAG: hypothetical protein JNK48_05750 [Bryobacterales bacterium]|nr:hypothetical protein [Bryobacterales bacterium]